MVKLMPQLITSSDSSDYIKTTKYTTYHHDIFLDDQITLPKSYRDVLSILFSAADNDSISIIINSEGGDLDSALAIVDGLKITKAFTTAIITGACLSAASIISMYCHNVVVMENSYVMIHTASFGAHGSSGNVKAHTEFTVKRIEAILQEAYDHFLTKDEINKVKNGAELWFDSSQVKSRYLNRIKFFRKSLLIETKEPEMKVKRQKGTKLDEAQEETGKQIILLDDIEDTEDSNG